MFKPLGLFAACLLYIGSAGDAVAGSGFRVKETLNRTQVCESDCFDSKRIQKISIKGSYQWSSPIMELTDANTTVTAKFGEFEFARPLGEAEGYTPGDTKATFYDVLTDGQGREKLLLKLFISWHNQKTVVKAVVFQQNGYAEGFLASPSGAYSEKVELRIGMRSGDTHNIELWRRMDAAIKVKQKQNITPVATVNKSRITLKAASAD